MGDCAYETAWRGDAGRFLISEAVLALWLLLILHYFDCLRALAIFHCLQTFTP
jgi:hypothetical protein